MILKHGTLNCLLANHRKNHHSAQDASSQSRTSGAASSKVVETSDIETEPSDEAAFPALSSGDQNELYSMASRAKVLGDGHTPLPQVLLSLALAEDPVLDIDRCRKWLQDFPALAMYATVQGVYQSNSTLLILSIPIIIWDWLPEDPACTFIGYIYSKKLLSTGSSQQPSWKINSCHFTFEVTKCAKPVRIFLQPEYQISLNIDAGAAQSCSCNVPAILPYKGYLFQLTCFILFIWILRNSKPLMPERGHQNPISYLFNMIVDWGLGLLSFTLPLLIYTDALNRYWVSRSLSIIFDSAVLLPDLVVAPFQFVCMISVKCFVQGRDILRRLGRHSDRNFHAGDPRSNSECSP